ncbi:hypothetical protein PVAP13_2NG229800 [Panicum virgatum]|uniref:Uncharacterized protein n=1 Tax=Panicum virgatum TaxID=38727 RepID=A0A8T0VGI5_PANVG|nr:hypothetical protein PVAP13_2NG229800 [Panicum virgatum]
MVFTLVEPCTPLSIATLEDVRTELCMDVMCHDAVKRVIALKEDWIMQACTPSLCSLKWCFIRALYI